VAGIDCPHGVAPGRMPKADATGLAPKKSADTTLPYPIRRCGRVWFRVAAQRSSPGKLSSPVRTEPQNPSISLVKPRSGGLGLQNAKTARPLLPGAPNGFFLVGIPAVPTRTSILSHPHAQPPIARRSVCKGIWETSQKISWESRGERSWSITF